MTTGTAAPTRGARQQDSVPADTTAPVRLEHRDDGRLWAVRGATATPVHVRPCFPWSEPSKYLSLRDDEDDEIVLVRDPSELDAASRQALEGALVETGFLFRLTHVLEIEEEVELRRWHVRTEQGDRTFQTRLDEWPRRLPDDGLLIRDVNGDLYHLAEPGTLDAHSRSVLWAFVDS